MAPGGGKTRKSDEEILQERRDKILNRLLKKEKETILSKIIIKYYGIKRYQKRWQN